MANGELSKFECISTAELAALLEAIGHIFGADQPTAAGPGGSDQPTFSKQMPAPDPMAQYHQQMDDPGFRWTRNVAGPSAPDRWYGLPPPLPSGGWTNAAQVYGRPTGVARLPGGDWANFEKNARPSANIEDYRRTRGKPFVAQ